MKAQLVCAAIAILLGGCSSGEAARDTENYGNVDEILTTENVIANDLNTVDAVPPEPKHRYDFREGNLYGYIAAVSEEDRKRGKAAGDVVMFRYAGFWDSTDHLEQVDASGRTVGYDECKRPCVAIKSTYNGRVTRLAYDPSSIVGAAFQDAMNGVLQPPPRPGPADSPEVGSEANNISEFDTYSNSAEESLPAE